MYYILNQNLEPIGIFSNDGKAAPFFDDLRNVKIADNQSKIWQDTLEISAPYGYDETYLLTSGNHLLTQASDGDWYCYRVYDWQDDVLGGTHIRKASCYNLAIWDFYHSFVFGKTFTNANSRDVALYITAQTNWHIVDFRKMFVGGSSTHEVPQGNVQAAIDDFITKFDCEVRAYVEVENGRITNKYLEIVDELGKSEGLRYEYRHNILGLSRKSSDIEMYTKLYVFGGQDTNGKTLEIGSVNDGVRYLLDVEANDQYNDGKPFLEGVVENTEITNPTALKQWGAEQLKKLNHPKFEYTVDVDASGLDDITLGDHAVVVDFEMVPELTISARVIEIQESKADAKQNKIVLGEFITIKATTPSDITKLQEMATNAHNEANKKAWRVELLTPDGLDFENETVTKRIIARVFRGDEDVTSLLLRSSFLWEKIDAEGNYDKDWATSKLNSGNYIEITHDDALSTIRCNVDDNIAKLPSVSASEEDLEFMVKLQPSTTFPKVNATVHQYAHYDVPRNNIYWTKVTTDTTLVSAANQLLGESFIIIRTDMTGKVLDFMTVKHGGHGSHYGFEYKNGKAYFLSPMYSYTNGKEVWTCEFPYNANTTIDINHSTVVKHRKNNSRINLDVRNNMVLTSYGMTDRAKFNVYDATAYKSSQKLKSLYSVKASDFGILEGQVYQSSCLDFPYLYVTYGVTHAEGCCMYCIDLRTNTRVYNIDYQFDGDNIKMYQNHAESETINYYYDADDVKWMMQSFNLREKDSANKVRRNEVYRFKEKIRIDENYEEDLDIDDRSDS